MILPIDLVDGLFIKFGGQPSGFTLTEAEGVGAHRLGPAADALKAAVDAAVEADRKDSVNWWDEFLSFVEHGLFGYQQDRREFEAKGEKIIRDLQREVEAVREQMTVVRTEVGHVPGDLEADARRWRTKAEQVSQVRSRITALRQIPGWISGASSSYTARSIVQDGATEELRGLATSMANAISQLALFNRALFLVMEREIKATTQAVQSLQPGAKGYHYRRVANALDLLRALRTNLQDAQFGRPVRDSADALAGKVTECLSAPQLLEPGTWPTGGGQASVPPAPTDSVPDPDEAESRVDDPAGAQQPGGTNDGVKR